MRRFTFTEDKMSRDAIATLTTLTNGFVSIRGDPEFLESRHGTFISGVYSFTPVFYRELVNLPRAHSLYLELEGVPLAPEEIRYVLDAGRGLLEISATLSSPAGRLEYSSRRFVHRSLKGLVGLKARVRSLDASGKLCVRAPIELDVANPSVPPEVSVRLYRLVGVERRDFPAVDLETADGRYRLRIASLTKLPGGLRVSSYATGRHVGQVACLDISPGAELSVERFAAFGLSPEEVARYVDAAQGQGFEPLLEEHERLWRTEWSGLGLSVEGDEEFADALFLNTFHLLQLYNDESDVFILPARGLHGYGYRGHVFWDTDIYAFPFYLLFKPEAARKILEYRCRTLSAAIENARRNGYRGAQYPWESADDGLEATPREVPLDLSGEKKVRIFTGELEHHITADIAYAVDLYYRFTGDRDFLERCGLRILVLTARFWASRAEWDPLRGKFVIRNVIGPDEYHVGVDNNFYTNVMAKHNLELAVEYARKAHSDPALRERLSELQVSQEEVRKWADISSKLEILCRGDGLCEQFEGYFSLKDFEVKLGALGEKSLPSEVTATIQEYQVIKQADVVAALFLLRDRFTREVLEKNYEYYLPRTTHASSLSLPMYAALALYLGRVEEGYGMLKQAALADIADIYGNACDGFHVGSAGGVWMAILFGLFKIQPGEKLSYERGARLGNVRVSFNVTYRGVKVRIEAGGAPLQA
jgi:kojibiose phosphorylase